MTLKKRVQKLWQLDNYSFAILWDDGKEMHYQLKDLQELCPCALCHETRQQGVVKNLSPLKAKSLESVGSYAMKIHFEDGCSLGIYEFDFLYNLEKVL